MFYLVSLRLIREGLWAQLPPTCMLRYLSIVKMRTYEVGPFVHLENGIYSTLGTGFAERQNAF